MRFTQVFEDLEEFVGIYRECISREGMLLHTDTLYHEGTVLVLEITLEESLSLIRGTAGVVSLMRGRPETDRRYSVVLEFLQLDDESQGFIDRLVERLENEGGDLFRLEDYVEEGRRGLRRPPSGEHRPPVIPESANEIPEQSTPEPSDDVAEWIESEAARKRRAPGSRLRWLLGVAASGALLAVAAVAVINGYPQLWMMRSADPGHQTTDDQVDPAAFSPRIPTANATIARQPTLSESTSADPTDPAANDNSSALATVIERIAWTEVGTSTLVTVEADGDLDEAAVGHFLMKDEPRHRVVLYLYGIGSDELAYRTDVGGDHLDAIRVWYHDDKVPVQLHIVLDLADIRVLASPPAVEGSRLLITLTTEDHPPGPGG
jgi:hypothetical protein